MAGILSGLASLGLDGLENIDIYEVSHEEAEEQQKSAVTKVEEKDFIYSKKLTCPVCDTVFSSKIMKTGKARLLGTDRDLRPTYEGIDAVKYDVHLCSKCGYTALSRFFPSITSVQAKLVRENISTKVRLHPFDGEIYTYEEALERYKLALANAVVKRAKASEKAYICLKSAWLLRGYVEYLDANDDKSINRKNLKVQEEEYLINAYNGFLEARQSESFPMCGMDQMTVEYLVAELAYHFKKYDMAGKLVASILTSPSANSRMKDKARDLKEEILAEIKKH